MEIYYLTQLFIRQKVPTGYHLLKGGSLTKESDDVFVIGATLIDVIEIETEDKRHHSKLIRVDKEGNFLNDYTYFEDTLSADVNGLIRTADNGFLYCGRNGRFIEEKNNQYFLGRIVKLQEDFSVEWELSTGDWNISPNIELKKILTVSDSEFVAVGFMSSRTIPNYNQYGWLIKFNIARELIWKRKYYKVPHYEGDPNYPTHKLYLNLNKQSTYPIMSSSNLLTDFCRHGTTCFE